MLKYDDFVASVAARGNHLLVSAGPEVLVHNLQTCQLVHKLQNLHDGHVTCVEGTQNGKMLFTGAQGGGGFHVAVLWGPSAGSSRPPTPAMQRKASRQQQAPYTGLIILPPPPLSSPCAGAGDGLVMAHDLRMKEGSVVLW